MVINQVQGPLLLWEKVSTPPTGVNGESRLARSIHQLVSLGMRGLAAPIQDCISRIFPNAWMGVRTFRFGLVLP